MAVLIRGTASSPLVTGCVHPSQVPLHGSLTTRNISGGSAAQGPQAGGEGEQTRKMRAELYSKLSVTDDKIPAPPKAP